MRTALGEGTAGGFFKTSHSALKHHILARTLYIFNRPRNVLRGRERRMLVRLPKGGVGHSDLPDTCKGYARCTGNAVAPSGFSDWPIVAESTDFGWEVHERGSDEPVPVRYGGVDLLAFKRPEDAATALRRLMEMSHGG